MQGAMCDRLQLVIRIESAVANSPGLVIFVTFYIKPLNTSAVIFFCPSLLRLIFNTHNQVKILSDI